MRDVAFGGNEGQKNFLINGNKNLKTLLEVVKLEVLIYRASLLPRNLTLQITHFRVCTQ